MYQLKALVGHWLPATSRRPSSSKDSKESQDAIDESVYGGILEEGQGEHGGTARMSRRLVGARVCQPDVFRPLPRRYRTLCFAHVLTDRWLLPLEMPC